MRIAIVNDMTMAVEALRRVIAAMPGYQLAWIARNGDEAVKSCAQDTPNLILMDLVMPVMDGVEATRRIMARTPCAILIVTATVEGNAPRVLEALGAGALDAVQTPALAAGAAGELKLKIASIGRLVSDNENSKHHVRLMRDKQPILPPSVPLVAMGASAGGPNALAAILNTLPSDFSAAIVIVQHIDADFAPSMASWLAGQSALAVRTACEGDRPQPGTVLVAASKDHMVFLDSYTLGYTAEPRDGFYRPSVDVFFESVARHWRGAIVGVLLSGMGRDGARGLKTLREVGALTIAQDSETSVVYGMPKAAAELGAAVEILPVQLIASRLMKSLKSKSLPRCV
jgi:two-component system, chemotaxis family, response regulator WspF